MLIFIYQGGTLDLGLRIAAPLGTFIGPVLFGWFADLLGRKRMCEWELPINLIWSCPLIPLIDGVELMVIVIGSFGQAVSSDGHAINIFWVLIVWRFVVSPFTLAFVWSSPQCWAQMGIGIGGDYPSSAVIASEFSPKKLRGRIMTAVFANQGWGQLCKRCDTIHCCHRTEAF